MGGLLAARALADHFARVTILERDALSDDPSAHRKGVPQSRHAHGLLGQGRVILEGLFPGLTAQLERDGAMRGDLGAETAWFHDAGFHRRHDSGIVGLFASRALLEAHVRRRVLELPNVDLRDALDVTGLMPGNGGSRVVGVSVMQARGGAILDADLVVDASGRGSRLPAWLASLGFARPDEERVPIDLCYTTRLFRDGPRCPRGAWGIVKAGAPSNTRGGALLRVEGDRWILTMGGYAGDHAPLDHAGMLAYARGMGAPQFAEVLDGAEPIGEPVTYRYAASVRHRYERLRRFPDGLLAFADAICTFNPVYGQGMTVAAMQSLALRDELARGPRHLARRFFRRAGRIVDTPWTVAVGGDARILDIRHHNGAANRLLGAYLDQLHLAARSDAQVANAFLRVANLMAAPATLLAPATLWRVWRGARAARAGTPGQLPALAPRPRR